MTPSFRLFIGLIIAGVAMVVGFLPDQTDTQPQTRRNLTLGGSHQLLTADDVDAFVTRTFGSGLFPDAELLGDEDETSTVSVDQVAAAIADPNLVAFVKYGDRWTVFLNLGDGSPINLQVSDTITEDWHVDAITATSLTISRGDETRLFEAFPSGRAD